MIEFTENSTMPSRASVSVSSTPSSARRKAKISADIVISPKRITGLQPIRSETLPMIGPALMLNSVSSRMWKPTLTPD